MRDANWFAKEALASGISLDQLEDAFKTQERNTKLPKIINISAAVDADDLENQLADLGIIEDEIWSSELTDLQSIDLEIQIQQDLTWHILSVNGWRL